MTAVTSKLVKRKRRWDFLLVYQLNYICLPVLIGILMVYGSRMRTLVWLITSPIALLAALKGRRPIVTAISSCAIICYGILQFGPIMASARYDVPVNLFFWMIALPDAVAL